jgi:hypothetical protein
MSIKDWTIKDLENVTGTLSKPSKMPCFSYSLPASKCITGGRLRVVENSTCSDCYAMKNFYRMPSTVKAMQKRFDAVKTDLYLWKECMLELITRKEKSGYFRWHDSGDLQSVDHLVAIAQIAVQLPKINFWLPTREYRIVSQYIESGKFMPENLTIRLSAHIVDSKGPQKLCDRLNKLLPKYWNKAGNVIGSKLVTSTVGSESGNCVAPEQGGKCLDCRACWISSKNIQYKQH